MTRGRPPIFDQTAQAEYLRLLTDGIRVGEAADKLGISRRTPNQHAARNQDFARLLADAKTRGHTARNAPERLKHGDPATYNHHECRCAPCTRAATAARTKHRHTTQEHRTHTDSHEPHTTAQVHPLPTPQQITATTKLLMLADVG